MMDPILPALIAFGILLAIAVFGLIKSNASADRLNGSGPMNYKATGRREDTSRMSGNRP